MGHTRGFFFIPNLKFASMKNRTQDLSATRATQPAQLEAHSQAQIGDNKTSANGSLYNLMMHENILKLAFDPKKRFPSEKRSYFSSATLST
jgi:hypothetical protein